MRGRTNISTGTEMTVNGDVIKAIAAENIQAREFVSYEINPQIKEILNVDFLPYDSNADVKVSGSLIYVLSGNVLYIFESLNEELVLKSVYSDYIIFSFEIINPNYVIIVTSSSSGILKDSKLITLLENNGILSYVAEINNPFDSVNDICMNYANENLYIFSSRRGEYPSEDTTRPYKYYISFAIFSLQSLPALSLIVQNDNSIESIDGEKVFLLYKSVFCNGKFAFLVKYSSYNARTHYGITFARILINEGEIEIQGNASLEKADYYDFAFPYSKWLVCGIHKNEYSSVCVSAPEFVCINSESLLKNTIDLKILGFDKTITGKNARNYSVLSISKIEESKLFVSVLIYRTDEPLDFLFDCGILSFDPNTGMFQTAENTLDLKEAFSSKIIITSNTYDDIDASCFFAGKYYILEKNKYEYKFSYVEIPENNSILSLPVNKNSVKKYDGGIAIGFSKTSAKANEEIQIYIPKK